MSRKNVLPPKGTLADCQIQHFSTKEIREVLMKCVREDDCEWRTADDGSELNNSWAVIDWKIKRTTTKTK